MTITCDERMSLMKMVAFALSVLPAISVMAANDTIAYAHRHGARVQETICVVDQDGKPVANAQLYGGLTTGDDKDDYAIIKGVTDTNGQFLVVGKCTDFMRCQASKPGYYASEFRVSYLDTHAVPAVKDGRWQPYGNRHTIVLKQMVNPQPMLCRDALNSIAIPKHNAWLGFDFEQYDFVSPYGNGKSNDVLLRFDLNRPSNDEYYMTMKVSFTNQPYAGAYKLKKDAGSELKIVYEANTNGCFNQNFIYRFQRGKDTSPIYDRLQDDEYLVFRTRTCVDKDGNLISAHYGVICGEWNFAGPTGFRIDKFMFNPRPNDINLEDVGNADYSRERMRQRVEQQVHR